MQKRVVDGDHGVSSKIGRPVNDSLLSIISRQKLDIHVCRMILQESKTMSFQSHRTTPSRHMARSERKTNAQTEPSHTCHDFTNEPVRLPPNSSFLLVARARQYKLGTNPLHFDFFSLCVASLRQQRSHSKSYTKWLLTKQRLYGALYSSCS